MSISYSDRFKLFAEAENAINAALKAGDGKHPNDWLTVSLTEHMLHLEGHFRDLIHGQEFDEEGHRHIQHLICRAVMISEKLRRERDAER